MNIFEVSNINSTLKKLKRKKIFGFMALTQKEIKILLKLNGVEKIFLLFGSEGFWNAMNIQENILTFLVKIDINKND